MSQVTTRGEAQTIAKILLDEKNDGFWSQTQQNVLCDQANLIVFRELIKTNYEYFLDTATFTYPANFESINLATTIGISKTPYKIIELGATPSSGSITPDNLLQVFRPMRFSERHTVQRAHNTVLASVQFNYVLLGGRLFLAPIPTEDLNCRLAYIAPLGTLSTANSTLLGGKAHEVFGDCVGYCLAWLMNAKQHDQNPAIDKMWGDALMRMQDNAVSQVSTETGHVKVTRAAYE